MKKLGIFVVALVLGYFTWQTLFRSLAFDVEVRNSGKVEHHNIDLRFDQFNFRFGILPVDAKKVFMQQIGPWPKSVSVSWSVFEKSENTFTKELSLPRPLNIQSNESLELVVEFKDGGPIAYPRARGDESIRWRYRYKD